jgi:hypothetical protein
MQFYNRIPVLIAAIVICAPLLGSAQKLESCSEEIGKACNSSAYCKTNSYAKICIGGQCQVACENDRKQVDIKYCVPGETCVQGDVTGGQAGETSYYCKTGVFSMDLNLLDTCIYYFMQGISPDLTGGNCSIQRTLTNVVDANGDGQFDIFDVDQCIRDFIGVKGCNKTTRQCEAGKTYCDGDTDCGNGLFCNVISSDDDLLYRQDRNFCQRECGLIVDRTNNEELDRKCFGNLKRCDAGKCIDFDLDNDNINSCDVDADCPKGAYCFVGKCAAKCYSSIQCPDSNWFCSTTNRCMPKPPAGIEEPEPFDPRDYSVVFAVRSSAINAFDDMQKIPILIMDMKRQRVVNDRPNIVFGYRMEVKYEIKQEQKCYELKSNTPDTDPDYVDCNKADNEAHFITLLNPFGTIFGDGDPTMNIRLDDNAVSKLSPGMYKANVTAIFSNGDKDSITVTYEKPSANGDYWGRLSVYMDEPKNQLADVGMGVRIFVDKSAPQKEWDTLLNEIGLQTNKEMIDKTTGWPIYGSISNLDSLIFSNPKASSRSDNKVSVRGIYTDKNQIRLIAVIDIGADFCISETGGTCRADVNSSRELQARNPFGRNIRRIVELKGPFFDREMAFKGNYRETVTGLAPYDITMSGDFILRQTRQDNSRPSNIEMQLTDPNLKVAFPKQEELAKQIDESVCASVETNAIGLMSHNATDYFSDDKTYKSYLENIDRKIAFGNLYSILPRIFDNMANMEGEIGEALSMLRNDQKRYMTLWDYLKGQILFCHESEPGESCIDNDMITCGLTLYRKALLEEAKGEVPIGTIVDDVKAAWVGGGSGDFEELYTGEGFYGKGYKRISNPEKCASKMVYYFNRSASKGLKAGFYNVYATWPALEGNTDSALYNIRYGAESDKKMLTVTVNQQDNGGKWVLLATIPLPAGVESVTQDVEVLCKGTDGKAAIADAIAFEYTEKPYPAVLPDPNTMTMKTGSAIQRGWVDPKSIGTKTNGGYTLFCPQVAAKGSDCAITSQENPALFTLREHNRFYREYVQTASYQAGEALSDAFYMLYKASEGDALDQDYALSYKRDKLYDAIGYYDAIEKESYGSFTTRIMYNWPMGHFAGQGKTWLAYLNTAVSDRLDSMLELIDLKRRVLSETRPNHEILIRQMIQIEYLKQLFLIALQREWQGGNFQYQGAGQAMLDKASMLAAKINESRNPLGFFPEQVIFENSDLTLNNWQNYRKKVEQKTTKTGEAVQVAIQNMKDVLKDRDTLEVSLMSESHQYEAQIDQICGPNENLPEKCTIPKIEKEKLRKECLKGDSDCLFEYRCDEQGPADKKYCQRVETYFTDKTATAVSSEDGIDDNACEFDIDLKQILTTGGSRYCIRGEMGNLLREQQLLNTQREQTVDNLESLMRQIARMQAYYSESKDEHGDFRDDINKKAKAINALSSAIYATEHAFEVGVAAAYLTKCSVIAGVAAGGDCPTAPIAIALLNAAAIARILGVQGMADMAAKYEREKKELEINYQWTQEDLKLKMDLDNLVAQAENYVHEYVLLSKQIANLDYQIQDKQYIAEQVAARYSETLGSIIDRLIGRESGTVLLRNKKVKEANMRFQDLLLDTYKMAQAYNHRYNSGSQSTKLVNEVFASLTLNDIAKSVEALTEKENNYCGKRGVDCDYVNNKKIYRLSLRETLCPKCKTTSSGTSVVTAGQQFHAMLVRDWLNRTPRASGIRSQIELPVSIFLQKYTGKNAANGGYMVNPQECNHFIAGQKNGGMAAAGTIAVNVYGQNLPEEILYELKRGNVDWIRSCTEKKNLYENALNKYIVGFAPQNLAYQREEPPDFIMYSNTFSACINNSRLDEPNSKSNEDSCFNFFARDRSLATDDMELILPFVDDEQKWILGEGVKDGKKPMIEDIVLYFRYNAEPNNSK